MLKKSIILLISYVIFSCANVAYSSSGAKISTSDHKKLDSNHNSLPNTSSDDAAGISNTSLTETPQDAWHSNDMLEDYDKSNIIDSFDAEPSLNEGQSTQAHKKIHDIKSSQQAGEQSQNTEKSGIDEYVNSNGNSMIDEQAYDTDQIIQAEEDDEMDTDLLSKVFGARNASKKSVLMEFSCFLDGEKVGEVMVLMGETKKVVAKSIKEALAGYLLDDEIAKINKAIDNDGFVSFKDLDFLKLKTKFDMSKLHLKITVPIEKKKTKSLRDDSKREEKPNVVPATLSGFVNVRASNSSDRSQENGTTNSQNFIFTPAINLCGVVLEGECSYQKNSGRFSNENEKKFHRDYTSIVYDCRKINSTFRLGDVFSYLPGYNSMPRVWGFGFEKEAQRSAAGRSGESIQITILRPSKVEVYVNEMLVKTRENVFPGTYILDDISYNTGPNDVKVKITDDSGRERILDSTMFYDSSFIKKGAASYGVTVGHPEINNKKSGRYDKKNPVLGAFVKYGLTNTTECSIGFQKNKIGRSVSYEIKNMNVLGTFTIRLANSEQKINSSEKIKGKVFFASYESPSFDFYKFSLGFGGSTEIMDSFFYPYLSNSEEIGDKSDFILRKMSNKKGKKRNVMYHIYLTDPLDIRYNASFHTRKDQDKNSENSFMLSVSKNFFLSNKVFSNMYVNSSFEKRKTNDGPTDKRWGIDCSIRLASSNTSFSSSYANANNKEKTYVLSASHGTADNALFGNVSTNRGNDRVTNSTDLRYSHSRFLSNIAYSRTGGKTYSGSSTSSSSTQVGIESGLFFADGAFGVSAPFNSSSGFVIAKVKGIENSVKFNDGQYKSGILGGAVLPTNKDSISKFYLDLTSLPDNVDIKQNSIVALGEYKRGGVAEISSESGLIIIGILKDQNGKAIDMVSGFAIQLTKTKEKEPIIFFTNSDGKFVMSGVAPGKYRVSVNMEGVDDFEIEIPNSSKKPIMDLGVMICHITDENTKEN